VKGEQREEPHPHIFVRIEVVHELEGQDLDPEAVRRAIELSATRYCTSAAMLSAGGAEIHHRFVIRHGGARLDEEGEVIVTGPGAVSEAGSSRSDGSEPVAAMAGSAIG
jgi:hypothetical protein